MKIAKGRIREVLIIKLQRGDELTSGIRKACIESGVKNGVILSMIGSLFNVHYIDPIADSREKCGVAPVELRYEEPVEVMNVQGEICHYNDEELFIHLHVTFADAKGVAFGGHITGEDNMILNTMNIFIGVIDGVDMGMEWDDVIGLQQFNPRGL